MNAAQCLLSLPIATIERTSRDVSNGPIPEGGPAYSITSSAIESNPDESVRPSNLAVFRFMTNTNFSWLNDWQIGWLDALQNSTGIACLTVHIGEIDAVAYQPTGSGKLAQTIHRG